jgi:hypothetical protein
MIAQTFGFSSQGLAVLLQSRLCNERLLVGKHCFRLAHEQAQAGRFACVKGGMIRHLELIAEEMQRRAAMPEQRVPELLYATESSDACTTCA